MPEIVAAILQWAVPALVVFGVTAIAVAVIAWAIRQARRSPRARKAAEAQRDQAGAALVRLDDAVDELDLEVGLSGALYGGGAPSSLRRARLSAQHVRDASFEEYRTISGPDASPAEIRRVAARIRSRADSALKSIEKARAEHGAWVRANVSAPQQIASRERPPRGRPPLDRRPDRPGLRPVFPLRRRRVGNRVFCGHRGRRRSRRRRSRTRACRRPRG